MAILIITLLSRLLIFGVVTFKLFQSHGWVIALAAFIIIAALFYIIELFQSILEKQERVANFLDYQFGDGFIDENNKLRQKWQPPLDMDITK